MSAMPTVKRVTWWRDSAPRRAYDGYLALLDEGFRLAGREEQSGIEAALTVPHSAVFDVRTCACNPCGSGTDIEIVLEIAGEEPIVLRPLTGGEAQTAALARRLRSAVTPARS